jgi:hypothetical protein
MLSMVLIACLVWELLMFYAQRSALDAEAQRRFGFASGAYLFGWLVLAFVLGDSGIFQATASKTFPALAAGIGLLIFIGVWLLARSSALQTVLAALPLPLLVSVQLYRALGVMFLLLYGLGRLPGEFAIPAGWGDIAVGLAAPIVGYLFHKGYRWSCLALLGWNVIGILDLVVAVATGFLSSPGPFQAVAFENPNMLITAFPLVLVPLYAVPLSVLLHLAALKRLKSTLGASSDKEFTCGDQLRHWGLHPVSS